ncbi:MAG: hypothetical protein NTY64_01935 [Deltaproteobacteria bacterium]|nr:hypothetical protein [Deltaproteobacteria bacterium]
MDGQAKSSRCKARNSDGRGNPPGCPISGGSASRPYLPQRRRMQRNAADGLFTKPSRLIIGKISGYVKKDGFVKSPSAPLGAGLPAGSCETRERFLRSHRPGDFLRDPQERGVNFPSCFRWVGTEGLAAWIIRPFQGKENLDFET